MTPLITKVNVAPGWSVTELGVMLIDVSVDAGEVTVTLDCPVLPERLPRTV